MSPSWWPKAADMYAQGLSTYQIAPIVQRNHASVYRALKKSGVTLRAEARVALPHKETGYIEPGHVSTAHNHVVRLWGSASRYDCVSCGEPAKDWAYDGTDPTYLLGADRPGNSLVRFSRFPEFYMPLCILCHKRRDRTETARELSEYRQWKRLENVSSIYEYLEREATS